MGILSVFLCPLVVPCNWQCPAPANRCPYNADNANEEYAADYGGYANFDDLTEQAMDIRWNLGLVTFLPNYLESEAARLRDWELLLKVNSFFHVQFRCMAGVFN